MRDDRSQAYTLEGVFAAIIVLSAMLYGLQIVDVGPWTSESAERTEQLRSQAADTLDLAASNGTLSRAVRCYGTAGKRAFDGGRLNTGTPRSTTLERMLNKTFDERDYEYNLYFYYWDGSGEQERVVASRQFETSGDIAAPSDAAAIVSRRIAVYDDQSSLYTTETDARECGTEFDSLKDTSPFYMPDAEPDKPLYNIVEVRLVVW
ncbi:DUF7288 family protein [Halorientalis marina]|jgi:hypothetical protein|uniref:DUF7288 family protein n=1 Tax=Halorientalis marina TaxID=2931976 RepID=UPI001FF6CDF3|nr:hypothetical protein [Halorientalis marina]